MRVPVVIVTDGPDMTVERVHKYLLDHTEKDGSYTFPREMDTHRDNSPYLQRFVKCRDKTVSKRIVADSTRRLENSFRVTVHPSATCPPRTQ